MLCWKRRRLLTKTAGAEYERYIHDLCCTGEVQRLRSFPHHREVNRFDHAVLVSYLSFALARRWGWDEGAAARGGLLHDLFFTPCDGTARLCFTHPETACANAAALTGDLTDRERNIILSHMWPAGRHLPRCREAWMVDAVDTFVTLLDLTGRSGKYSRALEELVPSLRLVEETAG